MTRSLPAGEAGFRFLEVDILFFIAPLQGLLTCLFDYSQGDALGWGIFALQANRLFDCSIVRFTPKGLHNIAQGIALGIN
jgi:hypothetical protein